MHLGFRLDIVAHIQSLDCTFYFHKVSAKKKTMHYIPHVLCMCTCIHTFYMYFPHDYHEVNLHADCFIDYHKGGVIPRTVHFVSTACNRTKGSQKSEAPKYTHDGILTHQDSDTWHALTWIKIMKFEVLEFFPLSYIPKKIVFPSYTCAGLR